jgi:hypothetical protein
MWLQLAEVGVWAGLYLWNRYTAPKTPAPIPRTRDSLDLPRTEEGTPVPIVYGRCQVTSPVLVYASDLDSTVGPDNAYIVYGLHLLFVVGIPMGNGVTRGNSLNGPLLHNVWMGDKLLPSPGHLPRAGATLEQAKAVYQPNFLGGPGRGGGLIGSYQWFGGWTDQSFTSPPSPIGDAMQNLSFHPAANIPGHRKQMCVSFQYLPTDSSNPYFLQTQQDGSSGTHESVPLTNGFTLGENPNVNGFAFEVSCYGDVVNGVTGAHIFSMTNPGVDFGGGADPIEVIYDILTNPWGRLGIDASKIDLVSFAAASATLKAENHGYSRVHYSSEDAHQVLSGILAQIDAALYEEPTTGKFVIKLIRQDYDANDPAQCPVFDESNIVDVTDSTFGSWRESVNEVRVRYTDASNQYSIGTAVAGSMANAAGNANRRRVKMVEYLGCTSGSLAASLAARDMNVLSTPLGKITLVVNRDAWMLRPGQVFKVTWPKYGINGVVFRANRIDLGQLEKNEITIDAIQDAFATTYVGQSASGTVTTIVPSPVTTDLVVEAPRWLAHEAHLSGLINDPAIPRVLALPSAPTNGFEYFVSTKQTNGALALFQQLLVDVPRQKFPTTFTVASTYARELEPYDTTTGLVVSNVTGPASSFFAVLASGTQNGVSTISFHGQNLTAIITATGDVEFVAFESVTDLGGGTFRLNNVWRGLLDTAPLAHAVGERCVMLDATMIGRRSWSSSKALQYKIVPCNAANVGSGGDPLVTFASAGYPLAAGTLFSPRAATPYPPSNVGLLGRGLQGTQGSPSLSSSLKSVSLLDEGVDLVGLKRAHRWSYIMRGDTFNDPLDSTLNVVYLPFAWPAGLYEPTRSTGYPFSRGWNGPGIFFNADNDLGGFYLAGALFRFDMFGAIDVGMTALLTLQSADPDVGKGGVQAGVNLWPWSEPRIRCFAPHWRNLLCNVNFDYGIESFTGRPWGWGQGSGLSGTTVIGSSSFSLQRKTSGDGSHFLSTSDTAYEAEQSMPVTSWHGRGMTAVAVIYIRNANSDANDTGRITLLTESTTLATGTATAGPTANWSRLRLATTMNSDKFLKMKIRADEVAVGGTAAADTCFAEAELRLGQLLDNVLLNYSFESGLTSWTTDAGTMTTAATVASPSANYATNATAANSQIHQDYTFASPAGWDTGSTAFLTCFRGSTIANNTGEVIVQALDGSSNVLASGTTGAEVFATLNVWNKRTVFCDVPDGTTKIRVIFKANYSSGATSGHMIDEVALWIAKDLVTGSMDGADTINNGGSNDVTLRGRFAMNARYQLNLDFATPTIQPTPTTWQEFVLAYPTLPVPTRVLGGYDMGGLEIAWTDATTHAPAKMAGQFGGGVGSINAYGFSRASGSAAPHLAAIRAGIASYAAPSLATPFTCAILYRVDEPGFATACGLIGRMDLAQGWGLELNASGQPTAILRGAGATSKTVSLGRSGADGAVHLAVIVNDPVAQLLYVYDEAGSASVSTASGLGEILGAAASCHLRIGRDADDRDVLPGHIARAWFWEGTALTSAQVLALWGYAKDPTGKITTYTRTALAAWSGPADDAGETIVVGSASQVAIPYKAKLATATGAGDLTVGMSATGYGLAVGRASTNRIQSFDFTNASFWLPDASTVLTQGVIDPTGRPRGVTIAGNASNGLTAIGVAVGAFANAVGLTFWARGTAGTNNLTIELRTSAGALVTSTTVSLTALWKRYDVSLAWAGATATCRWRFVSSSGALTFDLGGVVHSAEHTSSNMMQPALIPLAATTHGDYNATIATTIPAQFNSEGEIVAYLNDWAVDPAKVAAATLVQVKNGTNTKNQRELQTISTGKLRLAHTDGAASPATVNSDVTPAGGLAGRVVKARARWSRADMLDTNAPMTAQVAYSDDATATVQLGGAGRTTAWTNDTTPATTIVLGAGTAAPDDVLMRSVTIQAREEKLP